MKKFVVIAILGVLTGGTTLQAKETSAAATSTKVLAGVPAAEIPATIAKTVANTPKEALPAVLNALLRRVAKTQPALMKHVVTAVVKQNPNLAPLVAALAARALPGSVGVIAAAAASAAPNRAGEILALCSHVTVVGRGTLAEVVASINPTFSAATLASDASAWTVNTATATSTTTAAASIGTGTIIQQLPPADDDPNDGKTVIGNDLNGDPVYEDEESEQVTGTQGSDGDRYGQK